MTRRPAGLRSRSAHVAPLRRPKQAWQRPARRRGVSPILVMAPLATFTAVFLWDGGPPGFALELGATRSAASASDVEGARFTRCVGPERVNCVVDGDTFWYRGAKIRLSDVNAPEVSRPGCAREAALGARATERLLALLNAGRFTLAREPGEADRDRYGRLLREVTRGGESLGDALRAEGLAERWKGYRGDWC